MLDNQSGFQLKFIDSAKVFVRSGKGGAGCVSFLHEKFREFGGPDGGDGGRGGDVYVVGARQLATLQDLRLHPHQNAGNGQHGMGANCAGKSGKDKYLQVPLGTVILNEETNEILAEVLEEKEYRLLEGGKGGQGNARFKTSTNRAPRYAQPGEEGKEAIIRLDLKLMADIGLVGFPNAGKSTFISSVSKARPKIADYPFTTLVPNLGVVKTKSFQSFVIADIPGIIEGAHQGIGLGTRFLRHIQRTAALAFLVECTDLAELDPIENYKVLIGELEKFSPDLLEKERLVLLTKVDSIGTKWTVESIRESFLKEGIQIYPVSSVTKEGVEEVVGAMSNLVQKRRESLLVTGTKEENDTSDEEEDIGSEGA